MLNTNGGNLNISFILKRKMFGNTVTRISFLKGERKSGGILCSKYLRSGVFAAIVLLKILSHKTPIKLGIFTRCGECKTEEVLEETN